MTTSEMQTKDIQRARQKIYDIVNKEVRGCLKSAFDAHPEGPKFESIRKRIVKEMTRKNFLERIKPWLKDVEAFT